MEKNYCELKDHEKSKLSFFCFEKNCKHKKICCSNCIYDFHHDHLQSTIKFADL